MPPADPPKHPRALPFVIAWLALAAVLGFVLGRAESEPSATKPRLIESGPFALLVPGEWRAPRDPTEIPGLDLTARVERALPDGSATSALIVGVGSAGDGSLLSPELRRRASGASPDGAARLANLEALHYGELRASGSSEPIELFAGPVRDGALTAVCVGADPGFRRGCRAAVATLRRTRGDAYALGADRPLQAALDDAIARLNAARARGVAAMRRARRTRRQATAAGSIAAAYAAAARKVASGSDHPATATARRRIVDRLDGAEQAWRRLARAARGGSVPRYESARRLVESSENGVRAALAAPSAPAPQQVESEPGSSFVRQQAPDPATRGTGGCGEPPHEFPIDAGRFRGFVRLCETRTRRSLRVENIAKLAVDVQAVAQHQTYTVLTPEPATFDALVLKKLTSCDRDGCTLPPGGVLRVEAAEPVRYRLRFSPVAFVSATFATAAVDQLGSKITIRESGAERLVKCAEGVQSTAEGYRYSWEEGSLTALANAPRCKSIYDDLFAGDERAEAKATKGIVRRWRPLLKQAQKLSGGTLGDLGLLMAKTLPHLR